MDFRSLLRSSVASVAFLCCFVVSAQRVIDISGRWQFAMVTDEGGPSVDWFAGDLEDDILLPGSMPQRLKGFRPTTETIWTGSLYDSSFFYNPAMEEYRRSDNLKLPFFLTPDCHYVGRALYKRSVDIPADMLKGRVVLFLERPHIETCLWVNGREVGTCNSLCVPHVFDVTDFVHKGSNTFALCIDNSIEGVCVGADSHSVTDQTQGNWNGIVGRMELQSSPAVWIDNVQVYPDIHKREALVRVSVKSLGDKDRGDVDVRLSAVSFNTDVEHVVEASGSARAGKGGVVRELVLEMGEGMLLWDEFSPSLYRLSVCVDSKYGTDSVVTTFGMREFCTVGKLFYVNGRPTMLRGTVENCDFPLTGYAPMCVEDWERVFRICRSYGLNHMRFHSFCPPEAAFVAADLVGFYLQPEGPSWPNHGVKLGNGMYIDSYLLDETRRMNRFYGNHASFCMLACGNEPAGNWVEWVSDFVDYWRGADDRHVYTGASVGGGWAWQPRSMYHVKAGARGLDAWRRGAPQSVDDFSANIDTVSVPFVSHETGQWCVFPNFEEIDKYKGVNKARNFEIFRDLLERNGMGRLAHKFMLASGRLQALCYKYEIEKTLRTRDYAGFELLALNDYSGQGTALVGVTDVFFDDKGYCSAEDFREFCGPTVALARIGKFTYWNSERFVADVEAVHYGRGALSGARVTYRIEDDLGRVYVGGVLKEGDIPLGCNISLGKVDVSLSAWERACKLSLVVEIEGRDVVCGERVCVRNHWNFWVYPVFDGGGAAVATGDVYESSVLDDRAREVLSSGGCVLLTAAGYVSYGDGIVQQFTPVFWNTSWFKMRPPHTTGLYIDSAHPVFRDFPTDFYSDLQWWELVNRRQVMLLSEFPADFQPIVQSIDTWFLSRKIGMLFEARVGGGRLMMTTMPIDSGAVSAVSVQLRHAVLDYMNSDAFRPEFEVDIERVGELFTRQTPVVDMYTKDSPDELKPKLNVLK